MDLLKEIKTRLEKNDLSPEAMYMEMKVILMQMYMTNSIGKDNIVKVCSDLIGLYYKLKDNNEDKKYENAN